MKEVATQPNEYTYSISRQTITLDRLPSTASTP